MAKDPDERLDRDRGDGRLEAAIDRAAARAAAAAFSRKRERPQLRVPRDGGRRSGRPRRRAGRSSTARRPRPVGPRPIIKRAYRKPILITLAVILVAAASTQGFLLSDRGPTEAQQAHTAYLAAVDKVVNTLAEQQQSGRETLAAADEQREQIEATGGLANTYEATGDDLDALKVQQPERRPAPAAGNRALVDKAQSQYATMRQAAETNDKPTYDATTAEVVATGERPQQADRRVARSAVPVSAAPAVALRVRARIGTDRAHDLTAEIASSVTLEERELRLTAPTSDTRSIRDPAAVHVLDR